MSFTVRWVPSTKTRLAEIWMDSENRRNVTEAAHEVDRMLTADPFSVGESRGENRRVLFARPLMVVYEILEDEDCVDVLQIKDVSPRR